MLHIEEPLETRKPQVCLFENSFQVGDFLLVLFIGSVHFHCMVSFIFCILMCSLSICPLKSSTSSRSSLFSFSNRFTLLPPRREWIPLSAAVTVLVVEFFSSSVFALICLESFGEIYSNCAHLPFFVGLSALIYKKCFSISALFRNFCFAELSLT